MEQKAVCPVSVLISMYVYVCAVSKKYSALGVGAHVHVCIYVSFSQ